MKWDDIGDQPCPIAKTLSVLGDRWTMLILRNAFMGIRRFDDFQRSLGLTRHILAERLKRLVEHDILVKVPYVQRQERFEYRLTEKGLALYPILLTMMQWAEQWMETDHPNPVLLTHKNCGQPLIPKVVCNECEQPIDAREVQATSASHFVLLNQKTETA